MRRAQRLAHIPIRVLLLTNPKELSPDAAATIGGTSLCISDITFLGGTGAVSHEVRNEVIEILN